MTEEENERKRKAKETGIVVNIRRPTSDSFDSQAHTHFEKSKVEKAEVKSAPQISDDMLKELISKVGSS